MHLNLLEKNYSVKILRIPNSLHKAALSKNDSCSVNIFIIVISIIVKLWLYLLKMLSRMSVSTHCFPFFPPRLLPTSYIISIKTAWQKTSCGYCRFLCICPGKMAVIDVNTSSWWQFNHLQASKYVFINDRLINFHIYAPSTDKAVAYKKF